MSSRKSISNTLYVNCVQDGIDPSYIEVKGTGLDNPMDAYVKIYNGETKVTTTLTQDNIAQDPDGDPQAGTAKRGLAFVAINRSTLEVAFSQFYDTYYSSQRINALYVKMASYLADYFTCIFSYDACGINSTLESSLKKRGSSGVEMLVTGRYPFAFLGYYGLQEGFAMQRQCNTGANTPPATFSTYVIDGMLNTNKDGDDGVTYEIRTNIENVVIPSGASQATNVNITGDFIKRKGEKNEESTYAYGCLYKRTGSSYAVANYTGYDYGTGGTINIESTVDAIVLFMFKSAYQSTSPMSQPYFAKREIPVVKNGARGKVGRFFYYGGEWDASNNTTSFIVTDAQAPYFSKAGSNADANYVYDPDTNPSGGSITMAGMWSATSQNWNHANWQVMTNDFKYLITEALFAEFAHLGGFVVSGDYMISEYGVVRKVFQSTSSTYTDSDGTWTLYKRMSGSYSIYALSIVSKNKTVTSPSGGSAVAYTYFLGFDMTPTTIDNTYIEFFPTYVIDSASGRSKLGNTEVEGKIHPKTLVQDIVEITNSSGLSSWFSADSCPSTVLLNVGYTGSGQALNITLPSPYDFAGVKITFIAPANSRSHNCIHMTAVDVMNSQKDIYMTHGASTSSKTMCRVTIQAYYNGYSSYWKILDAVNVTDTFGNDLGLF